MVSVRFLLKGLGYLALVTLMFVIYAYVQMSVDPTEIFVF